MNRLEIIASRIASNTCKRLIFTGPPGAGKTTLINRLRDLTVVVEEQAREVIKEWNEKGKWDEDKDTDKQRRDSEFQKEVFDRSKAAVDKALESNPEMVIFDRTHLDCLAYGYVPEEPPEPIKDAEVWLFKLKKEHFRQDEERRGTYAQAVKKGKRLKKTYEKLGYDVIEIDAGDPNTWPLWARKKFEGRHI